MVIMEINLTSFAVVSQIDIKREAEAGLGWETPQQRIEIYR